MALAECVAPYTLTHMSKRVPAVLIDRQLWDVDTGECMHVFRGHINQIYAVAFDGKIVASGGLDTIVRVWGAHTVYAESTTRTS